MAIGVITAEDLAARLDPLRAIGFGPERGTNRLAWTAEDAAAGAWFEDQAASCGLRAWRDAAGNRWATPPGDEGPWWAVGSHTDSVRDGGAFDGALGVAAAFAIAAASPAPLAVLSFADEEGARFNTPTFGSRALTGVLDVDDVLARTDDDGVTLADAMAAAGTDPMTLPTAPQGLSRLRGFAELHIDQSTDLADAAAPWGVVTSLAARLRLRATATGTADHAGTTPMDGRQDALLTVARLIAAAHDLAPPDLRATVGRILVEPNALTAIAARATAWVDARSPLEATLDAFRARLAEAAAGPLVLAVESRSPAVTFDAALRARLAEAASPGSPTPELVCWAGHDAGILAPHVPAAMVLVRNATGVSHSPAEHVELDDAAAGATAILHALS